ncbi:MAG TPA: hypothetical protein VGM37_12925 [Armatimonadota bacterium]
MHAISVRLTDSRLWRGVCALIVALAAIEASAAPDAAAAKAAESLNLVRQLERLAGGKPIPVAAAPEDAKLTQGKPIPEGPGKPLIEALQDIAAAFTDPVNPETPAPFQADAERRRSVFQPYAFRAASGSVWTIASDRRLEDVPPKPGKDALDELPDFEISTILLKSLSKEQLQRSTRAGLRWADYTEKQQAMLRRLLGRPYAVYRTTPLKDGDSKRIYAASSDDPMPVERCALHLYIGFDSLSAPTGKTVPPDALSAADGPEAAPPGPAMESYPLRPDELRLVLVQREMPWRPRDRAVYDPKMKPSDLDVDAPSLATPIGVSGVMTLEKAVSAAAAATKLPLMVDKRLGRLEAFVGDPAMRCGDALRLLTYSFDGAWRKVGGVYLLTWDRMGKAAAMLDSADASYRLNAKVQGWDAIGKSLATPNWESLLPEALSSPPDVPISPDAAQWAALAAPPTDDSPGALAAMFSDAGLFQYSRLDPAQQDTLQRAFANRRTTPDSVPPDAPFPREALEASSLNSPALQAFLDIPGIGRVNASRAFVTMFAYNPTAISMTSMVKTEVAKVQAAEAKALSAPPKLDYPTRAVAPPPLSVGEWARLFAQMERKGLNAVYLPVLWDGQSMFPSANFPLLPVCRGEDLLAKALALAKGHKIRVIAVLHTLGWRLPSSNVHWLSGRPELVEVDARGDSRREWALRHPLTEESPADWSSMMESRLTDPLCGADCVRSTDPEVRRRLLGFARELCRYKGLDGVALADWTRIHATGGADNDNMDFADGMEAPDVGYSLPERTAFLRERGVDPLDIVADSDDDDAAAKWDERLLGQDVKLAKEIVAVTEARWPGGAHLFSRLRAKPDAWPPAAAAITDGVSAPKGSLRYVRMAPPVVAPPTVTPDGDVLPARGLTPEEARRKRLDRFHVSLAGVSVMPDLMAQGAPEPGLPTAKGIVLDFTGSPDLMWDALSILANK